MIGASDPNVPVIISSACAEKARASIEHPFDGGCIIVIVVDVAFDWLSALETNRIRKAADSRRRSEMKVLQFMYRPQVASINCRPGHYLLIRFWVCVCTKRPTHNST